MFEGADQQVVLPKVPLEDNRSLRNRIDVLERQDKRLYSEISRLEEELLDIRERLDKLP